MTIKTPSPPLYYSKDVSGAEANAAVTSYATVHNVGTAGYAAEEVQYGKFGSKTDVFAAGVVLLQLATGKPAVVVDKRGVPAPLRRHLLAQRDEAAAAAPPAADGGTEAFAAFAASQVGGRCVWVSSLLGGEHPL